MKAAAMAAQRALDSAITCGAGGNAGSADLGANAVLHPGQLVAYGVDGSRSGLEDGRGIERHPAEAHGLERGDAGQHGVVVRVEAFASGVPRRRSDHALEPDGRGIAAGFFGVAANGSESLPRAGFVFDPARQPAIAEPPDATV